MPFGAPVTDVTCIDDAINAIVGTVTANVAYPVFDGPPTSLPARATTQFVVIGADTLESIDEETAPPVDAASMAQTWQGLGQPARYEDARINCVAVGRADSATAARSLAMGVLKDVGQHIGQHPTTNTYNALIAEVLSVRTRPTSGGTYVHVQFVITINARLT